MIDELAHTQYIRVFSSLLGLCNDKGQKENYSVVKLTRPDKKSITVNNGSEKRQKYKVTSAKWFSLRGHYCGILQNKQALMSLV